MEKKAVRYTGPFSGGRRGRCGEGTIRQRACSRPSKGPGRPTPQPKSRWAPAGVLLRSGRQRGAGRAHRWGCLGRGGCRRSPAPARGAGSASGPACCLRRGVGRAGGELWVVGMWKRRPGCRQQHHAWAPSAMPNCHTKARHPPSPWAMETAHPPTHSQPTFNPPDIHISIPNPPVSWFSRKVTERLGHQPIRPGGLPATSRRRQYSQRSNTACMMPLVVMSGGREAVGEAGCQ